MCDYIIRHMKRIPMGKWQCPSCQKGKLLEPTNNLDAISKRARTKIVTSKSRSGLKSSERNKISQIFGNSIIAKKRSSKKGKSVLSHGVKSPDEKAISSNIEMSSSVKSDHLPDGASLVGISPFVNIEDEKKLDASPTNSEDEKSTSLAKEAPIHFEAPTSEAKDEASVAFSSLDTKPCLSTDNPPQGNKVVLAISATTEEARKRKHIAKSDKRQKKSRTDKGKGIVSIRKQKQSGANTASPGSSKSRRKHKSINCQVSVSLTKENIRKKNPDVQGKDEVCISFII